MKNITFLLRLSILIFGLISAQNVFSQSFIWSENFTYSNGTTVGTGNRWTLTTSGTPTVFAVSGNRFIAQNTNAVEQVLQTEVINISNFTNIELNVDVFKVAGTMEPDDYVNVFYKLNGGSEVAFATNGTNYDDFPNRTATQTGLNGTTIQIIVRIKDGTGGGEIYGIDNITVEGITNTTIATFGPDGDWRYLDDGSDQGTAWRATAFDDSSWSSGNAELGFGDGDENTTINDVSQITNYFRKAFTVTPSQAAEALLTLNAKRDDGMVVYVNGTEVWRDYMPTGTINYNTQATTYVPDDGDDWQTLNIPNVLVAGTNVIAVEIHQNSPTSSDVSFNFDISVSTPIATIDTFGPNGSWRYLDDGSNQGTAWRASAFDDSSWNFGYAELGFGDGDEATVVANVNQMTTYFRKTVNVSADEASMARMILDLTYDDGAVVYINGTEVWRVNMPGGTINYLTASSSDSGDNATASITLANTLISGDNVIAVEIHQRTSTSSDISFNFDIELDDTIIYANGPWYYLDDGTNQGTAWQTADVTPSGANWASGNAELGYGDGDETTVVSYGPSSSNKYPTTYFRKTVNVSASQAANSTLTMKAIRDDGMVVYINGAEVWRDGMPTTFDYLTYANVTIGGADESTWITSKILNVLNAGINEIAVEIHQTNASSSDLSFNFEMFTDNTFIFIPPTQPDNDGDGIADYKDTDDDNDGITDLVEGCHSGQLEDLNSDPFGAGNEESLTFPISTPLTDGNQITYTTTGTFDDLTSYDAGDHGWSIRAHGPNTAGTLTMTFDTAVDNLSFRLIDFDENETWTVNAYDDTNTLVDLTTDADVYFLGSYIQQSGNTFTDSTNGLSTNHNGEDINSDIYGTAYFYFPVLKISRIEFVVDQPDGSTIRLAAIQYCDLDTDGDTIEDYHDLDSDNDGIPDLVEAGGTDINGNGTVNVLTDTDGDGLVDDYDNDANNYNFGEISKLASKYDFDGDGIINSIDLDSDNDGILDIIEIGSTDADANGMIDGFTDSDLNGYHDSYDGAGSRLLTGTDTDADGLPNSYPTANADGTGFPNFLDIDSDDDGITDNTEAQVTSSFIAYSATDSDGDGILNIFDNTTGFSGNGLVPIDTDFDCIPDYLDTNSDDDLENDIIEGHDTNGDGVVNGSDSPNADTGLFSGTDTDGDGLDDGFDNNDATFNATNSSLQPTSHPIFDGLYDRDWRASNSPIDFDGTDDFIDFGDNHDFTGSFSLEAWVLQQTSPASEATIMSKADAKSGNRRGYQLTINSSNLPNLTWYNASGTAVLNITSAHPITNNKWYHIAATYNGSTAKLYVDGLEVASGTTGTAPSNGTEKFMIGAMYDSDDACSGATKYFNGYIDEVRLWDVALSPTQLREMMNQEIQNTGGNVRGLVIPKNISSLNWSGLKGYYPMNAGIAVDQSGNAKNGFPKHINSTQLQTAPLPYTTVRNGTWKDTDASTPWTYGNTVWNAPNSLGIDDATLIDWNIVETNHDVMIETNTKLGRERKVLGLKVLSNELLLEGDNASGTGNGLTVTSYLELNGEIDLDGESQLIQTVGSDLVVGTSGKLYRDQQGTADTYTYNYWSSPVGITDQETNEYSYKLPQVMKDGTLNINFITSGYNGTNTSPIGLADYWIWKFANQTDDDYSSWQHVKSTGDIFAGEGFTMKGPGTGSIITDQNYVFSGKPNNGDINLTINSGNDYLVGNPYPSAIDAYQFINDNSASITGTLYFWEHWGGGSHILTNYQGGYHELNLSGMTTAATIGTNDPDVGSGGTPLKAPGNYIPVSQGFFVVASGSGGSINFNNGQRIFHKESSGNSTFVENHDASYNISVNGNSNNEDSYAIEDTRLKLRIGFNSINTIRRQLLATVDANATANIDWGYDGMNNEDQMDDMYWLIEDKKFVIQGIDAITEQTILPLGIHTNSDGLNSIVLDKLENAPENLNVFLHDKELGIYHNLKNSTYEIYIPAGEYLERFEITFSNQDALSINENELNKLDVHYSNAIESIVLINPTLQTIKSIEIANVLGQTIHTINNISNENYKEIEIKNLSSGTYIINLKTETGTITKKVLVE